MGKMRRGCVKCAHSVCVWLWNGIAANPIPSIKRCPLIARQCHFPIKTEQLSRERHDTRRYMPIQSLLDTPLTPSVPFCVPGRLLFMEKNPHPLLPRRYNRPCPVTKGVITAKCRFPRYWLRGFDRGWNHCTLFWPLVG